MRKLISILSVAILLLTFNVFPVSADRLYHGPIIKNKNGQSTNWSGYSALNGNATDVKGSWIVPSLTCDPNQNTYSSAWVGIDGDGSSTVEQIGTEQDCIGGQASYYAWYEMYPKPSFRIPVSVAPGQTMTAEVKYIGGGNFQLTLNGYSITQKSNKAKRVSAEWVMEAPWSGGVLPLANFGTANFSNSSAVMGPVSGTISAFTNDRIDMVGSSGNLKDQTSALSNGGANFSITWLSSN